jgi:hypothetical protein
MIRSRLLEEISKDYKALPLSVSEPLLSENMISDFVVELPRNILKQAQEFVHEIYKLRQSPDYISSLEPEIRKYGLIDPGNKSILMSYDFHVDPLGTLKLIEVNTNAAFLAIAEYLFRAQGLKNPVSDFDITEIKKDILAELKLNGKNISHPKIAIIDEKPETQRLYLEFLLFNEHFNKWGFASKIYDFEEMPGDVDFVYNRHTDFYLEHSKYLKGLFVAKQCCFSPNPFEYLVLADKHRMIEWEKFESPIIQKHLPFAKDVTAEPAEEIWSQRKKLFFKPKRAFGSKHTYRGESISRKHFEEILAGDFIAQEFVPAPEHEFKTPEGPQKFKFDLRFYAYQDRVQSIIARVYQGQVTNSKTKYGGFAAVKLF